MNILSNFEPYLKKWCEENHKPIPDIDKPNDVWKLAWDSYVKQELVPNWEQTKQEYLNMELLTKKEQQKREKQKEVEPVEEEKKLTDWEKVSSLLK